MLVGSQLGGNRPPVGGDGRDSYDVTHLKIPDQLANLHDQAHAFVAQDAVGFQAVDGHVVHVGGAGGHHQGTDDGVKAGGLGAFCFDPIGFSVSCIGECSHGLASSPRCSRSMNSTRLPFSRRRSASWEP